MPNLAIKGTTGPSAWALLLIAIGWLALYSFIFISFFIDRELGGDYVYFLPKLLDEYIFSRNNGWLSPQWFTPSFCGGFVGLANPQSTYWSVPHFLTFFFDPVIAAYMTMVIFASVGGVGFYMFARRLHAGWPAVIAALLFASNGYHVARMLEGHLGHHGFMLVPLASWLLVRSQSSAVLRGTWLEVILTACILGYIVLAAGGPIMPQVLVGTALFLGYTAMMDHVPLQKSLGRFFVAGAIAILILGPILLATASFMVNNARTWLPLPLFESLGASFLHGLEIILSPFRDTDRLHESLVYTGTRFE